MVRAKFRVVSRTMHSWSATAQTVVLQPEYDHAIDDDRRFAKATPSGKFEMVVDNPPALEQFLLGRTFYVDFSPID
jgi:hypothetical protein